MPSKPSPPSVATTTVGPSVGLVARVTLSPRLYHAVWRFVLILHIGHAVGYGFVAKICINTLLKSDTLSRLVRLVGLGTQVHTEVSITAILLALFLCGWHTLAGTRMLYASWRQRACIWRLNDSNDGTSTNCFACFRRFFVGVHSPHFDRVFMIRKTLELVSQAYQITRMTGFLPYPTIHHFAVVILVINCWSPLLIRRLNQQILTNRFMRLIANILATSCFTFLLPLIVFAVYKAERDRWRWFDPIWVTNVRGALQQMFINSWLMCFLLMTPQFTLLMALENVKSVAQRRAVWPIRANGPTNSATGSVTSLSIHQRSIIVSSGRRFGRIIWRDLLSVVFGICVVGAHVHAYTRPSPPKSMCALPMQPWLFSSALDACAAVEIDCHRLQIDGRSDEIDPLLNQFDAAMVLGLMFRHCQALEIPLRIQSLMNLVFFEIYNSTLVEWSAEAALTSATHPRLASVYLVSVSNMTQWPLGLSQPTMPATNVQVYQTDLSSFPDVLDWSSVLDMVFLEHSSLTQVPGFLLGPSSPNVIELSLSGNAITQVPAALLTKPALVDLRLNQNAPLHEFSSDCNASNLLTLEIQFTNVTQLPQCLEATAISAFGSPLCVDAASTVNCVRNASAPLVRFPVDAFVHD